MNESLHVRMCQTRHREPLACVDLPGEGAELRPAQMRALAAALMRAADECEAAPMDARHYRARRISYKLG